MRTNIYKHTFIIYTNINDKELFERIFFLRNLQTQLQQRQYKYIAKVFR